MRPDQIPEWRRKIDSLTFEEIYNEQLGLSYEQALERSGLEQWEKAVFDQRAEWLLSLGLNPNTTEHWQMTTGQLAELQRIQLSMQATGFPDTDLNNSRNLLARRDVLIELSNIMGENLTEI